MEERPLGSTGLTVSALGFGCGSTGGLVVRGSFEQARSAIARAIDAGVTYFDTAPLYGRGASEEQLGRVLSALGAWDRVVVGTKVRLSRDALPHEVRDSLIASLRRLGRERVDLVQLHNPLRRPGGDDAGDALAPQDLGPVEEALREVVREGLAGAAGFTGLGEPEAVHAALSGERFDTVQCYVNALNPSAASAGASGGSQDFDGLIGEASRRRRGVIAIRVMAAGALAGDEPRAPLAGPTGSLVPGSEYAADARRSLAVADLARDLGLESPLELSLRFAISTAGVSTALVGFSDARQLDDAIRWVERGPLGGEAVNRTVALARGATRPGGAPRLRGPGG